ncbi:MAG: PilZ domain-containing protein [Polyangiaceae bacterium]|nr:PilZ domain-containing protein [Polyangiaceae bacterium]
MPTRSVKSANNRTIVANKWRSRAFKKQGTTVALKKGMMANRKPLVSKSAKPMDTFDFLIRFWALRAKQAEKGTPLLPSEETELLTLLQVVGGMEPPLASAPKGVSFSARLISKHGAVNAVVRNVSAGGLFVTLAGTGEPRLTEDDSLVVQIVSSVLAVEYMIPARVTLATSGSSLVLVPDGVPSMTYFSDPPIVELSNECEEESSGVRERADLAPLGMLSFRISQSRASGDN